MPLIQYTPPPELLAILGPRWRLTFGEAASARVTGDGDARVTGAGDARISAGAPVSVYADASGTLQHSQPVTLDRFGIVPGLYLDSGATYSIRAYNEYGQFRFETSVTYAAARITGDGDVRVTASGNTRITAGE